MEYGITQCEIWSAVLLPSVFRNMYYWISVFNNVQYRVQYFYHSSPTIWNIYWSINELRLAQCSIHSNVVLTSYIILRRSKNTAVEMIMNRCVWETLGDMKNDYMMVSSSLKTPLWYRQRQGWKRYKLWDNHWIGWNISWTGKNVYWISFTKNCP